MSRNWSLFAQDMEDACRKICRYTQGLDQADFLRQELVYDATLRNLEIIGEAAKAIPDEARQQFPHINWKGIVGLRDVLAHAYFALDDDTLWDIVTNKVPELLEAMERILEELPQEHGET